LDVTKQREKLLFRRACARVGLKDFQGAIEDLQAPCLASSPAAAAKIKEVKDLMKKERARDQKVWSGAFARAAAAGEEEEQTRESPAGTGLRFASPEKSTSSSAAPSTSSSGNLSIRPPADDEDVFPAYNRNAGRTPHPKKGLGAGVGSATVVQEEETDTSMGWLLSAGAVAAAVAAVGLGVYLLNKRK
jgi:hypothetical protein